MPEKNQPKPAKTPGDGVIAQVADKIKNSTNVLVALSKDPNVDELSAALGLTFMLDKLGKHATAIFSGAVPNAIEFLEPEKTFESNTNSLQDFIIALNKDKADHLRYKIEGDFVKVFITPYRTTISEDDLEFSHGDYNVDLIIAFNVDAESDLDAALSEYGKIKHDASSVNISAAEPGKFGDLEWGDPSASSVSEMVADLAEKLGDKDLVEKPTATALLAGIVAATNRFSNAHTSSNTMKIAADLMTKGADQQLISSSIPVDILTNNVVDMNKEVTIMNHDDTAAASGSIELPHEEEAAQLAPATETPTEPEAPAEAVAPVETPVETPLEAPAEAVAVPVMPTEEELSAKKPDNVPDLPSPEPSPIEPSDQTPITSQEAPNIETIAVPAPVEGAPIDEPTPELEPLAAPISTTPPPNLQTELPTAVEAPVSTEPDLPSVVPENAVPVPQSDIRNEVVSDAATVPPTPQFQPAVDPAMPPTMPVSPNIESSSAEYVAPPLPMPGDGEILPPPPAPFEPTLPNPIQPAILQEETPAAPAATSPSVNGVDPVMQDQVYSDPGAFKIPGM